MAIVLMYFPHIILALKDNYFAFLAFHFEGIINIGQNRILIKGYVITGYDLEDFSFDRSLFDVLACIVCFGNLTNLHEIADFSKCCENFIFSGIYIITSVLFC